MCSPLFCAFEIKVRQYLHFCLWCPHGGYSYTLLFSDRGVCLGVHPCVCVQFWSVIAVSVLTSFMHFLLFPHICLLPSAATIFLFHFLYCSAECVCHIPPIVIRKLHLPSSGHSLGNGRNLMLPSCAVIDGLLRTGTHCSLSGCCRPGSSGLVPCQEEQV